jgi:hypothetical protein
MANDLKKRTFISYQPEIQAQAAVPYSPARAAWTEVKTTRVCEIVTKPQGGTTGGLVKVVTYKDGKLTVTWEYADAVPPTLVRTRVCQDVTTTIRHPAVPEQLARPAVGYQPAGLVHDFGLGWNAGARSEKFLVASGYAEFSLAGVGVAAGFAQDPEGQLWTDIEHGFYATRRTLKIVEQGVEKFAAGSFEPTDVLRIERIGSRVQYRKNGTLLYTSTQPSTRPVYLDASLYSGGDQVSSPKLETLDASNGRIVAAMRPPQGMLSDRPYAVFRAEMAVPTGELSALRTRFHGAMRPATALWADRPYARFRGEMRAPSGRLATGLPPPAYALFTAQMYPPVGTMNMLSGGLLSINTIMVPLDTLWADRPYAAFHAEMAPAIGQWVDSGFTQRPVARLPRAGLFLSTGVHVELTGPRAQMLMEAHDVSSRVELVMPAATLHMETGAHMALAAPAARMALEADVAAIARFELSAPAASMRLEAMVDALAEISMVAPAIRAEIVTGGLISMQGPVPTMHAEATTEVLAEISMVAPAARLTLEAQGEATAEFVLHAPVMVANGWVEAVLFMPLARARLEATVVVPVSYEAYAINLRTQLETGGNEVTRYTAFPFTRIVRWRGRYVAMAADGLYFLGGDTDSGQPIAWHLHTGTTDFGSAQRKAWVSCYVGGRMPPCSRFAVAVGEKCQERYPYDTPRGATAQNYRQKFGRGMDARYYALELSGRGALTIDDLDFEVIAKTRRI